MIKVGEGMKARSNGESVSEKVMKVKRGMVKKRGRQRRRKLMGNNRVKSFC